MSRKLSYTPDAFASRVRMSKEAALFIIVEGRELDTPFYEGIAKSSANVVSKGYQIWLVEQITRRPQAPVADSPSPRGTGGKVALLALFDEYKAAGSLTSTNSSGRRSIVFCVDRDVDDIAKTAKRSAHLVYTPMADAEATIFAFSNATTALARATSLSEADAKDFLSHNPDWMTDLARRWRSWIELCCLAAAHHAHCHIGTTKPSVVNEGTYGKVIPKAVTSAKKVIIKKSQFPPSQQNAIEQRVMERLRRVYASGNEKRLIGKHWINEYLVHLIKEHFGQAPIGIAHFKHRAAGSFLAELDFSAGWASGYRRKFEDLI